MRRVSKQVDGGKRCGCRGWQGCVLGLSGTHDMGAATIARPWGRSREERCKKGPYGQAPQGDPGLVGGTTQAKAHPLESWARPNICTFPSPPNTCASLTQGHSASPPLPAKPSWISTCSPGCRRSPTSQAHPSCQSQLSGPPGRGRGLSPLLHLPPHHLACHPALPMVRVEGKICPETTGPQFHPGPRLSPSFRDTEKRVGNRLFRRCPCTRVRTQRCRTLARGQGTRPRAVSPEQEPGDGEYVVPRPR